MVPRPVKEAAALTRAGYDVEVWGVWFDDELAKRDRQIARREGIRFRPAVDIRKCQPIAGFAVRLRRRMAAEAYRRTGAFSPELLGYGVRRTVRQAIRYEADLTIVHQEAGLWIGEQLLKLGRNVGVDLEDWHSEDLLAEDRAARPVDELRRLECAVLKQSQYRLTTSHVLATALAKAAQTSAPTAIYNTFPWADRSTLDGQAIDRHGDRTPSFHWFSQTLGRGRGLEWLMRALALVEAPLQVHLRGNHSPATAAWLHELCPPRLRNSLHLHGTVPNAVLLSRISEHDVGLALEDPMIASRDLTVTNKVFQYLLSGLAVIASDTAGQREVFNSCPTAGVVVRYGDDAALAEAITRWAANPTEMSTAKKAALNAAQRLYCWERQEKVLVAEARAALQTTASLRK
jgi:glycosyltransferase involved in cell wall biosynthesis